MNYSVKRKVLAAAVVALTLPTWIMINKTTGQQGDSAPQRSVEIDALLSTDEEVRATAERQLRSQLEDDFNKDMEQRQKKLETARANIQRLEELLATRKENQAKIVGLKLEMIAVDALGKPLTEPKDQQATSRTSTTSMNAAIDFDSLLAGRESTPIVDVIHETRAPGEKAEPYTFEVGNQLAVMRQATPSSDGATQLLHWLALNSDTAAKIDGERLTAQLTKSQEHAVKSMLLALEQTGPTKIGLEVRVMLTKSEYIKDFAWQDSTVRSERFENNQPLEPNTNWFFRHEVFETAREKILPIQATQIDDSQALTLVSSTMDDADCKILQAPRVETKNGQPVVIRDLIRRPLVVDFQQDGSPVVRDSDEGWLFQLHPKMFQNGRIEIAGGLARSTIDKVEIGKLTKQSIELGRDLLVQVPKIRTQVHTCWSDLPAGKSICIAAPVPDSLPGVGNGANVVVYLIRPTVDQPKDSRDAIGKEESVRRQREDFDRFATMMRTFAELNDSVFPTSLEHSGADGTCFAIVAKVSLELAAKRDAATDFEETKRLAIEQSERINELLRIIGEGRAILQTPAEFIDFQFFPGAKLNDPERPIAWYSPDGKRTYNVLYADMTVRQVPSENLPRHDLRVAVGVSDEVVEVVVPKGINTQMVQRVVESIKESPGFQSHQFLVSVVAKPEVTYTRGADLSIFLAISRVKTRVAFEGDLAQIEILPNLEATLKEMGYSSDIQLTQTSELVSKTDAGWSWKLPQSEVIAGR